MKISIAKPTVAFQGARGAFSEEAADRLLGHEKVLLPCKSFDAVFESLIASSAQLALVPIENTLAGAVAPVYDLLAATDVQIVAEVTIPIAQHLIGCPGTRFEDIRSVESHPVALAQCATFFASHPGIERRTSEDTAGSVEQVIKQNDPAVAAIAGRVAAEFYGGAIILEHLEDHRQNFTRFLLLTTSGHPQGPCEKMSLIFTPGTQLRSLERGLEILAGSGLNVLRLEARPLKGRPWSYRYFIDLGLVYDPGQITTLINKLDEVADTVRLLGHYPSATD